MFYVNDEQKVNFSRQRQYSCIILMCVVFRVSMSGLFSAIVIFTAWQTPLLRSPKWECTCWSGRLHYICVYNRVYMCGETAAHATVSPNSGWTAGTPTSNIKWKYRFRQETLVLVPNRRAVRLASSNNEQEIKVSGWCGFAHVKYLAYKWKKRRREESREGIL